MLLERLNLLVVSIVDLLLNACAVEPEEEPSENENNSTSGLAALLLPHSNLPPEDL